jgi:hypothetical protein
VRIGDGVMQRRREVGVFDDIVRAARPPSRQRMQIRMPSDDPQIIESEVLHHTRRGTDVPRFARLDENDA